jgi:hypothetical protein
MASPAPRVTKTIEASSSVRAVSVRGGSIGFALFLTLTGCAHATDDMAVGKSVRPEGATTPIEFKLDSLDDREVSTGTITGRPTVIAFVTTWDLSSQAQIDYLVPMAKRDGSDVNYVMVALQERQDRELVEVFAHGLGVTFLGAMADQELMAGGGSFGALKAVPTTVILDRAARMVWRHVGIARPDEIREGLRGL